MSVYSVTDSSIKTLEAFLAERREPGWLLDVRSAALRRFREMEWPTAEDEEFRRSDVSSYDFDGFAFEFAEGSNADVENPVGQSGSITFEGTAVLRKSISAEAAEKGAVLVSLQEAAAGGISEQLAERVHDVLLQGINNAGNRLALWHYATMTHGVIAYVPRFVELADPFVVTFDERGDGILRSPQLVAIGEEGARFAVVQRARGSAEGEVLFNEGVDVHVGDAGQIEFFGFQNVNIDSTYISNGLAAVGRDATFRSYSSVFGAMFSKYRIDVEMRGEGGDAFIGGVYFPNEDQHIDMRTEQRHLSTRAHSLTLYKGAITDEAHSVYQGLIHVDHDALNTDAYLTNNNLLLSDDGRADSIPTLQINTNEVRCSHGSTVGKLDPRHIYYLGTRGYSPEEARHILVQGFFEEILERYPDAVSDEIHEVVESRIGSIDTGD